MAFTLATTYINQYKFPVYDALISVTYINDNRNNKIFCQLYMSKLNQLPSWKTRQVSYSRAVTVMQWFFKYPAISNYIFLLFNYDQHHFHHTWTNILNISYAHDMGEFWKFTGKLKWKLTELFSDILISSSRTRQFCVPH